MSTYCSPKTGQIMTVEADLPDFFRAVGITTRTLRVMKLTAIFLLTGCLVVSARGRAQERVTLHLKGVSLETVLEKIQEQTGYNYVYSSKDLHVLERFDIDVRSATIQQVLDICFKGLRLRYVIEGRMIKILPAEKAATVEVEIQPPAGNDLVITVTSEDGTRLVGASIQIKALKLEGVTNEKGELVAKAVSEGKYQLEVTYVGYQVYQGNVEMGVRTSRVSVSLKQAINNLDQVQLIAYGQTTQRLSTGDVTTVDAKTISAQPISNPILALEGRVAGLFITQNAGTSGAGINVELRGQNSIFNGNDPFYVIDGVPYTSTLLPNQGSNIWGVSSNGSSGSPLNYINPADIESISVLKDADATAIYGSRAANGAILITTKKGRPGKTRLDVDENSGVGRAPLRLHWMDNVQYLAMRHEAFNNDGVMR